MLFSRFGVVLERLGPERLELVRRWRNSPWVRPCMRYRATVEPDDQARWFESLDPHDDWYFVARIGSKPFALFHVKGVDWAREQGEAGGFVGAPELIGRPEPAQATLALMDFAFLILRLRWLEAQYRKDLAGVVRFNAQLGYRVLRREADGFLRSRVSAGRYFDSAAAYRSAAAELHGTGADLVAPGADLTLRLESVPPRRRGDLRLRLR